MELISLAAIVVWAGIGATYGVPYYQLIRQRGEPATLALVKAIVHGAIQPPKKAVEGLTALVKYLTE